MSSFKLIKKAQRASFKLIKKACRLIFVYIYVSLWDPVCKAYLLSLHYCSALQNREKECSYCLVSGQWWGYTKNNTRYLLFVGNININVLSPYFSSIFPGQICPGQNVKKRFFSTHNCVEFISLAMCILLFWKFRKWSVDSGKNPK